VTIFLASPSSPFPPTNDFPNNFFSPASVGGDTFYRSLGTWQRIHPRFERSQQFHKALLSAFPTPGKLKQLVRFRLDENLEAISTGNLSETISNLIEWAEAEGKLEELLIAARKENPGNPVLRKFEEQMREG
jgi:hypothetical protein